MPAATWECTAGTNHPHYFTFCEIVNDDLPESEEENMTAILPEPTCTNLKDIDAQLREADQDEEDQLIDFVVETVCSLLFFFFVCASKKAYDSNNYTSKSLCCCFSVQGYITNLVYLLTACEKAGLTSSLHTLRSILLQLSKTNWKTVFSKFRHICEKSS